jgi:hypothetical protein
MAVTEILRGIGSWSVQLAQDTRQEILDALQYFGHICINTGPVDPRTAGDAMLASARYVGIYRGRGNASDQRTLIGPGLAAWLGDEDGKGEVYETAVVLNHDFQDAIPLLLPPGGSITAGTIFDVHPGSPFQWSPQYITPREAIDYVCQTVGADWRVNNNGTLDAGLESDLFTVIPKAAIKRRGQGLDMFLKAMPGDMATDQDMNDFSTRVVLLATGTEGATVTAAADIDPGLNPFVDLHGNPIAMTRLVNESGTDATNADARAQLQLNRFSGPRTALTMSTRDFDVKGDFQVGDYLWAYDPDTGVYDLGNEVMFRGERFWPVAMRLTEMTWPVVQGMSVAYRRGDGTWLDLTPYLLFESGDTTLVVGGYNRNLGADGGIVGSRPLPDTSVPGIPTWNTSQFRYSVYQSPVDGDTRAQVELSWNQPLNVDGSVILDGDHYEIQYRASASSIFPATHNQMALKTHNQLALGTHDQIIVYAQPTQWETAFVPFDQLTYMLTNLATNMPYEAKIRAVDAAKPPNGGDWSTITVFQTSRDTIPPATPAPPSVAASKLAIQITHTLGRSDGGTYNLDLDLHHLEVHGDSLTNFAPTKDTLLGKVLADAGMMMARTPVVASFNIDNLSPVFFKVIAVDYDGNASPPSSAVSATAELVDDAHISSLTVSKVTAGTITANWIMAGYIKTGDSPHARAQMTPYGFEAYAEGDLSTFWVDSTTGNVWLKGQVRTGDDDQSRIIINPGLNSPRIVFYPQPGFGDHVDMIVESYTDPRGIGNVGIKISAVSSIGAPKGGELEFGQTGVKMGHFNNVTNQWAYYWIDEQSRHALRGTFNTANFDSFSALVIGETPYSAVGDGFMVYNYGMTFSSAIRLVITTECDATYGGSASVWSSSISGGPGTFHVSGFVANFVTSRDGSSNPNYPGKMYYWGYRV